MAITVALGSTLLWTFFRGVIFPLRRMADDARFAKHDDHVAVATTATDELDEVRRFIRLLMADVAETRSDLEHSRLQLARSEKLAAVGKLAASVAHELRNPLTSIKMWLYSLRRAVGASNELQEKFDIVSEEIARLERIIRDFLEFSRPPEPRLSSHDVSELLEKSLELLRYRLEQQQVTVVRRDEAGPAKVMADADQLRQVLLNLFNNAIEAMPSGGQLCISTTVDTAGSGEEGLVLIREKRPEVVVTDVSMPGMNGLEAFREIAAIDRKLPVIVMTGHGSMNTAIEATKLGAFDYQLKPFEPESMLSVIERALRSVRLMQRNVEFNPQGVDVSTDAIVGASTELQEVFKSIGRVANTDATVLIRGESGTGKELVARAIYQHSLRDGAPLLIVNCVAIPETLLESELFGYERGAFTGAHARKIGKFEQAHGGTVFLDEIGDIPASIQAKLLRFLQQRRFERVGGNDTIEVDVRVMAATNRNLERAISEGTFREDLFHRLNVFTINIPSLRDRADDIPVLVQYFLRRYAAELKIDQPLISDEAVAELGAYPWPGNVRELEHLIYRTLILTRGYPIQAADIQRARDGGREAAVADDARGDQQAWGNLVRSYLNSHSGDGTYERLLNQVERLLICEALSRTNGNQTHAAQFLGLSRPTLHAKIRKFGIDQQR